MDKEEVTLKMTLKVDPKYASHIDPKDYLETVEQRINRALGFRGQVTRIQQVVR